MELDQFIKRALEIREKLIEFEKETYGREWNNLNLVSGFVIDAGDLMRIATTKDGLRNMESVDERLSEQLSDCFWPILIIAQKYNINIEKSFLRAMDKIERRLSGDLYGNKQ